VEEFHRKAIELR